MTEPGNLKAIPSAASATKPPEAPKQAFFYGWVIVAASFVQLTFSAGLGFYGLSVYLRTLNETRGFSVSSMSLATSIFWVASGVTGIFVAKLLATVDPRVIVAIGATLSALSLFLLGRVTELWQVFVVYVFFGAGFCFSAIIVTNTIITRWFHKRRSVALSIATTGLSVGGVVLTPQAAHLLDDRPLDNAFAIIAVVFFLGVLVLPAILLRPTPASKGQFPDGIVPTQNSGGAAPGIHFEKAISTVTFAAITAAFAFALLGQVGGISQLVKMASERAGTRTGNQVVSVLATCSVIGRLIGGAIVQRFSTRVFAFCAMALQGAGLAIIAFTETRASIFAAAIVFGLGVGNVLLLHPLLIAEVFGVREYARIYGRSQLFVACANAVGPLLLGWLRDNAGGYRTSYLVASGVTVAGFVVYLLRGNPSASLMRDAEAVDPVGS